jgi:hypothetical protein
MYIKLYIIRDKMNPKQLRKLFAVRSSELKQTKNLNVYSPAPETYQTFKTESDAKNYAKKQRELYNSVKIYSK